jgi:hypothetical protein
MAQKRLRWMPLVIAALLIGVIAMPGSGARADTIIFNDLTESPTLTHMGTDSIVTGTCSGEFICQITVTRAGARFQGLMGDNPVLNLAEDPQLQVFSDQVSVDPGVSADTVIVQFSSDEEGGFMMTCASVGGCLFQESGQPQGLTISWGIGIMGIGSDFVGIQSDVEGVPEPASWLLLATGLLGLLVLGSRSRGFAA